MDADKCCPLAVAVPVLGLRSETFVRSHANDVLPGRTASFGESFAVPSHWKPDGPTLTLYQGNSELERKVRHNLERRGLKAGVGKLIQFLKQNGVEAVMVEYLHSFLPLLPEVRKAGIRWYSFGHGYDVSALLRDPVWVERIKAQQEADGIFVRADSVKDRLLSFGFQTDRVHTVYSSAPVPDHSTPHAPKETMTLLYVGRMVPKKGPLLLLDAFAIASRQAVSLRLEMVGEGPLYHAAQAKARELNVAEKVTFHGGQPHAFVLDRMKVVDAYAQHSVCDPVTGDEEGLPASILEAMGHCLPVVSTRHAGIPEAVREGVDGFLSAEGDVVDMARNFIRLANDFELTRQMGISGWERALTQFCWSRERKDILRLTGMEKYA